jgi:uncharacterized membrane-anchored protein
VIKVLCTTVGESAADYLNVNLGLGLLMAEVLGLGYLVTGIVVASLITIIGIGWRLGLHSVLAFWIIYVLTRPLGASIGDYLSQPQTQGGLGLGATTTSLVFLIAILGLVIYLALSKVDVIGVADGHATKSPSAADGGRLLWSWGRCSSVAVKSTETVDLIGLAVDRVG